MNEEHTHKIENGRVVCSCGDYNCASLDGGVEIGGQAVAKVVKHPFICRHCKVPVVSKKNTAAILGREHGKHCPRRNK